MASKDIALCHSGYNASCCASRCITGMSISIHTIGTAVDVPVCMSIEEVKAAMSEDTKLQMIQAEMIRGWPQNIDNWNLVTVSTGQ